MEEGRERNKLGRVWRKEREVRVRGNGGRDGDY